MVSGIRERDEQLSCEITEEMVRAGEAALGPYDPNDHAIDAVTSEEAVKAVFVAMVCAQRAVEETTRRSSRCDPKSS